MKTLNPSRRYALGQPLLLPMLLLTWAGLSGAQTQEIYPVRPVTVIVPFTAGSQPDILARTLAEHMSRTLGQPFVILNRDGAGGVIGVEAVSLSKADGYTIGFGPQGQFSIQPQVRKNLKYKADDFEFLCQSNTGMFVIVAGPNSPYNTLAELIDAARKAPGKISFASSGHASGPHLIAESVALEMGVKFNHIPYRNIGDMYTQVIGGAVDFAVTTPTFLATRKDVKAFGLIADQRLPANPSVPTLKELGFKRSTLPGYIGFYAPRGMPVSASAALRKACPAAVESDGFKSAADKIGTPVSYADSTAYSANVQQDIKYMAELITILGIKPE